MPNSSALRKLASHLIDVAAWLLPESQQSWARAMRADVLHIASDRSAVRWALGCVTTGMTQRIAVMTKIDANVPRWLLACEMLLCFGPLTLGWIDFVAGPSGIIQLDAQVLNKYFVGVPGGMVMLAMMLSGALLGAAGLAGMIAAGRYIVSGRVLQRTAAGVLIAAPLLLGIIFITGTVIISHDVNPAIAAWREWFLLSVLPALGAMHLASLRDGGPAASRPAIA